MPLILLSGPEDEPLGLADAKAFLRVEHSDDDTLISALCKAARLQVERATGGRYGDQLWRLVLDAWPECGLIRLPLAPVSAVEAARLRDLSGAETVVDVADWILDAVGLRLAVSSPPAPLRAFAGIEIDVAVGGTAPEPVLQAMRLIVAHWYENRSAGDDGQGTTLPPAAMPLIAAERRLRV
jgi:uncharacterized phiE125 gp8 family phage protein